MASDSPTRSEELDPTAVSRKQQHIELAFQSQVEAHALDRRFNYEPLLSGHPETGSLSAFSFLNKTFRAPLWVSSMTGGTALAGIINKNLAQACAEFGLGMGLGSCRQLLFSQDHFSDFDVRDLLGPDRPLFANLGIAQVEKLLEKNEVERIRDLVDSLRADGLILHVNPLQEALQPEGDHFARPPIETVQALLEKFPMPVIVKEVGQGMGPASLKALLRLPLAAIEFAAAGGTNFAMLELLRSNAEQQNVFEQLAHVGHTAADMLTMTRTAISELGSDCKVKHLIISGGIRNFLDGYYLVSQSPLPAVYGQASGFLKHARGDYSDFRRYVKAQIRGIELAHAFLHPISQEKS